MKNTAKRPLEMFKAAKTTGELIKAYRENFEIKQDDMAHACKISQANLSAIEQGRREVGARLALRLAAFMGLSPEVVLYPAGYESEPDFLEVRERSAQYLGDTRKRQSPARKIKNSGGRRGYRRSTSNPNVLLLI